MGMVLSAIVRSATIYLPDMANLDIGDSTLVLTDTHHKKTLEGTLKSDSKLRGGLVKVGSGTDVLGSVGADGTGNAAMDKIGNADVFTLGSGAQCFRPLFDACVD